MLLARVAGTGRLHGRVGRLGRGCFARASGRAAVAAGAAVAALTACAASTGPELDAAMPAAATRGAMVMVTGRRLCGPSADCATAAGEIDLGLQPPMVRATVVSYADTAIEIVIPSIAPVGSTVLIATVDEESSNALAFEVLP